MENNIIMNHRGMITIPNKFRKKYHLKEGTKFIILDLEEGLTLIHLQDEEELRKDLIPHQQILDILKTSQKKELELENK